MSDPTGAPQTTPPYEERFDAPVVYFDISAAHGIMNGAIQVDLAHRILTPLPEGGVNISFTTSARLRCSPTAAKALRESIDAALKMMEQPQEAQPAASKLN
jgi:hypothetical protein